MKNFKSFIFKYLIVIILFPSLSYGQNIGVNNPTPDASAVLDITSTDKGLLVPRVALTSTALATPVATPATGLLVFNTATAGLAPNNVIPGFYFWNGASWSRFDTGEDGKDWSTLGNTGTIDGTNFIGTIDNKPLNFRINNQKAGKIDRGMQNVMFGYLAGGSLPNFEVNNVFIGDSAGFSYGTGFGFEFNNTVIGAGAGSLSTGTSNNTHIGADAGKKSTGIGNTSIGNNALLETTTGQTNVAIGFNAMRLNSLGSNSVAIGDSALFFSNVSGNTAIGSKAMFSNATGIRNTFVGFESGRQNITGSGNTALGNLALRNNSLGQSNIAIGDSAMFSNNTGSGNVSVGQGAGFSVTSANANTFIGQSAGRSVTLGGSNTFVGGLSGRSANSSFNSFFGQFSGANVTFGQGNVILGHSTAGGLTSGSNNTVVGWRSGISMGTGSYNTLIGDSTNLGFSFLVNASAFGSKALVGTNNAMVLGSIAGINGATNSVNVGIGTTTPAQRLHVVGNIRMDDGNQAAGKVMVSDALGTGTWQDVIGQPTYYTVKGTTNASAFSALSPIPQMSITLTPKDSIVFVHFSAAGFSFGCGQGGIFFKVLLNGTVVIESQTSNEDIVNTTNRPLWDVNIHGGIAVTPGVAQTISVSWITPNCSGVTNNVASPLPPFGSHRNLTIIDPAGPGGVSGTPVTTSDWSVTGNAGLTGANFLGTVDSNPLQFRQNNNRVGFFDLNNVLLGTNAGLITTGINNTFVGRFAGFDNNIGNNNTFLGAFAGTNNTSGIQNTFVGVEAGNNNSSGTGNAAIGFQAGRNNTLGSQNTFLGSTAGVSSGGSGNVYIGGNAGPTLQGSNNIAIGLNAGLPSTNATGSNNLYLGVNTGDPSFGANNSAAIGTNATFSASNSIVLGAIAGINNASITHNVGIGTNIPIRRLHVALNGPSGGTPNGNAVAFFENNNSAFIHMMTPDANENGFLFGRATNGIGGALIYNNVSLVDGFQFRTGGNVTRMALDAAGNLGVGIATPLRRLHVRLNGASGSGFNANTVGLFENNAAAYLQINTTDTDESGLLFGKPSNSLSGGIVFNNTSLVNGFQFRAGGNFTRMVIDATGNVGIGVNAPVERLEVAGNVNSINGDFYGGALNGVINMGGGIMNPLINIIADATPTPLNANGDEDLYIADALELGGQGFKPGGGTWGAASDARLKKDVQPFSDGLDKVLAINPVSFKYNNKFKHLDNGKTYIGVIAQEIKEVAPYTVELMPFGQVNMEDENGVEKVFKPGEDFYSYDASALTYMLINAVKELKATNDEQNRTIEELRREIGQLKGGNR